MRNPAVTEAFMDDPATLAEITKGIPVRAA
jgi:hypothetical protein